MNVRTLAGGIILIVALVLNACGVIPAGEAPAPTQEATKVAVAQATEAPTPTTPPTPTFEPVVDAEPTVGAVDAAVGTGPSGATGALAWRDQVLRNDAVAVAIEGLSAPANGETYAAWLSSNANSLALGPLRLDGANGIATLTFVSPNQENLLGTYDRVYITQGPADAATTEVSNVVMSGTLPPEALIHIRHVLVSIPVTPNEIGFALGLRQETDELLRHAQFLKEAFDAGDFALEKVHAEHIINIIRGSEARDVNGDGALQNPGDGFGLLPNGQQDGYIKGMIDHAKLAADAPDATEDIKLHASHVQIAGENTRQRIDEIRTLAEQIAAAPAIADTQPDVLAILSLAQQAIQGVDIDLDEQVGPIPDEGGVITAYQHAQLMAGIPLAPGAGEAQVAAPTAAPATAQEIAIEIGDNTFSPNKITVPAGTTIVWTSNGQRPHTVTADDGSFDSGTLGNGGSFAQTFDQPGTYPYYCAFHGGPGGEGMAGTIIVTEASAAAQNPGTNVAPPQSQAQAAPAASDVTVTIGDNTFSQADISIPLGATVVWTSNGQRPHTVTADDGSFDSGTLENGGSFAQTFDQPGTYPYYCAFHGGPGGQGMAGVIRVGGGEQSSSAPPAAPAAAPAAPVVVSMKDFEFAPKEIRVKAGTSVTWQNDGAKQHSATAVDGSFDTGLFGAGASQSVTFNQPGSFLYYCQLHGSTDGTNGMVGTVIVEP